VESLDHSVGSDSSWKSGNFAFSFSSPKYKPIKKAEDAVKNKRKILKKSLIATFLSQFLLKTQKKSTT